MPLTQKNLKLKKKFDKVEIFGNVIDFFLKKQLNISGETQAKDDTSPTSSEKQSKLKTLKDNFHIHLPSILKVSSANVHKGESSSPEIRS